MMFTTVILFVFLLFVKQTNGGRFNPRQADSLNVMRDKCDKNPYATECIQIKQQMEDLLRKCSVMTTPVPACTDVRYNYCFIWPRELYCYGGGQVTTYSPPWDNDPNWIHIPSSASELKARGDYCVTHQAEQKCQNMLSAIKVRYAECAKAPKSDASCQSFKLQLCSAFPQFSPCLNGGGGFKRRVTRLEHVLRMRK